MSKSSYARLHRKMLREKAEREAAELGPEECRRRLAEWAAQPGRTDAEVAAFNKFEDLTRKLDS